MGDLARQKAQIIERLQKEGLQVKNKKLVLPAIAQRIAVISSPTSAGLLDFVKQLEGNSYGYRFNIRPFDAVMQGNDAPLSIANALRNIALKSTLFDAVVIVRGGGANLDLSCFDSYDLAQAIAHFPLPVLTGIGHERDDTVCDVVAHTKHKTPTAVASFLIDRLRMWETGIEDIQAEIKGRVQQYSKSSSHQLTVTKLALQNAVTKYLGTQHTILDEHKLILAKLPQKLLSRQQEKLQTTENDIRYFTCNLTESKKNYLDQYAKEIKRESKHILSNEQDSLIENQKDLKEEALEELLSHTFPFDIIEVIGKGVKGADLLQTVRNPFGKDCGKICIESKRTKLFSKEWVEKLKADTRASKAAFGVLVTEVMPNDMKQFGVYEGIWVCTFSETQGLLFALRDCLIRVEAAV